MRFDLKSSEYDIHDSTECSVPRAQLRFCAKVPSEEALVFRPAGSFGHTAALPFQLSSERGLLGGQHPLPK